MGDEETQELLIELVLACLFIGSCMVCILGFFVVKYLRSPDGPYGVQYSSGSPVPGVPMTHSPMHVHRFPTAHPRNFQGYAVVGTEVEMATRTDTGTGVEAHAADDFDSSSQNAGQPIVLSPTSVI